MLENLENMSQQDAQEKLKKLNREIRKHEIALACYGIYKYSEPFELEKYLIELIYGENGK
jgi:hypothetical protein